MCPRAAQHKLSGRGLDKHDLEDITSTALDTKKNRIVLLDRTALIYSLMLQQIQRRMNSPKPTTQTKLGADSWPAHSVVPYQVWLGKKESSFLLKPQIGRFHPFIGHKGPEGE